MKLAFYAPLKSPDHPVPSGDRTMARSLLAALDGLGADVTQPSALRSRDGAGSAAVQAALIEKADSALPRIITQGRAEGWQAWITYHNYYKAPDLLGPQTARALDIPYLQIESTRARKRLTGPWADFAARAEAASDAAKVILHVTHRDREALARDAPTGQHLVHLPPFLNTQTLPPVPPCTGPMLSVGMLRAGDKAASYQLIADTLSILPTSDWQLHIAGDGAARGQIETLMAPFGKAVVFRGMLNAAELASAYANSSLLFWPGVNEAFGLAYLEAQAAGLPVVAQDRPGVCDVLAPGNYPAVSAGPAALAQAVSALLDDPVARAAAGQAAQAHVARHHLLPAARDVLARALSLAGVTL